jgi:hypothetical protein
MKQNAMSEKPFTLKEHVCVRVKEYEKLIINSGI